MRILRQKSRPQFEHLDEALLKLATGRPKSVAEFKVEGRQQSLEPIRLASAPAIHLRLRDLTRRHKLEVVGGLQGGWKLPL